jgi:hypothetical protein
MTSGEGAGTMRSKTKPSPEELEHILKCHLQISVDHEYKAISIAYVSDCGDKRCPVPYKVVEFYVCPSKPCPPGRK